MIHQQGIIPGYSVNNAVTVTVSAGSKAIHEITHSISPQVQFSVKKNMHRMIEHDAYLFIFKKRADLERSKAITPVFLD